MAKQVGNQNSTNFLWDCDRRLVAHLSNFVILAFLSLSKTFWAKLFCAPNLLHPGQLSPSPRYLCDWVEVQREAQITDMTVAVDQ